MKYKGSCHCGNIAFEVDGELSEVVTCNCSICQRKGALHWAVSRDKLHLLTKPEAMSTYAFNKHVISHRFCSKCGIHTFGEGRLSRGGQEMAMINVRCLEGVEPESLRVKQFNGRAL